MARALKGYAKTFADISRLLEMSHPTVTKYMKMEGAPERIPTLGWPIEESVAHIKYVAEKERSKTTLLKVAEKQRKAKGSKHASSDDDDGGDGAFPDLASLKLRELIAKCQRLELQVGVETGKYISKAEVHEKMATCIARTTAEFRRKFEHELPNDLEMRSAPEIQRRIKEALTQTLGSLNGISIEA